MPTQKEIDEEQKKINHLRAVVDLTAALLRQGDTTVVEALHLIRITRKHVLTLFPDKADTYDLIYKPRFTRILMERFSLN